MCGKLIVDMDKKSVISVKEACKFPIIAFDCDDEIYRLIKNGSCWYFISMSEADITKGADSILYHSKETAIQAEVNNEYNVYGFNYLQDFIKWMNGGE